VSSFYDAHFAKGGHIWTIPVPAWVKQSIDSRSFGAGINAGPLLRSINNAESQETVLRPRVVVKANAKSCGLATIAPHDLRRTRARLCHQAGGELEQIQFLLGHVSVQTTERYLASDLYIYDGGVRFDGDTKGRFGS